MLHIYSNVIRFLYLHSIFSQVQFSLQQTPLSTQIILFRLYFSVPMRIICDFGIPVSNFPFIKHARLIKFLIKAPRKQRLGSAIRNRTKTVPLPDCVTSVSIRRIKSFGFPNSRSGPPCPRRWWIGSVNFFRPSQKKESSLRSVNQRENPARRFGRQEENQMLNQLLVRLKRSDDLA